MEVECEYYFGVWEAQYSCKVSKANITSVQTEIKFKGKHKAGKDETSVVMVQFEETVVHFLPKGISNTPQNIMVLSINSCGLKSISREDLRGFDNLVEFDASNNKLKSLPSDLFIGKRKLESISFCDNQLEFVSSRLLKPLLENPLNFVNFRRNSSIDKLHWVGGSYKKRCSSIEELMDVIDKQCSKPPEDKDEIIDEVFVYKLKSNSTELWTTGQFSDFTIIANGFSIYGKTVKNKTRRFRVHKQILGLHSSVFAAMFENDMKKTKTGLMKIVNFSPKAVKQFLGYLYTAKVPNIDYAMALYTLAAKYNVPDLKKFCKKLTKDYYWLNSQDGEGC